MLQQMVIKMTKADKEFWNNFAKKLHCKDTTEFARKLTVIMRTTPTSEFREWFYTRLAKAEGEADAPVSRIVKTICEYALKEKASEIHIEPFDAKPRDGLALMVFYRVNDELREQMRVPRYVHEPLVTQIKSWSNLIISEHDTPQNGTLHIDLDDRNYRWPVTITPTEFGEKVVIQVEA